MLIAIIYVGVLANRLSVFITRDTLCQSVNHHHLPAPSCLIAVLAYRYRGYTLTRSNVTRYRGYTLIRSNVTRYHGYILTRSNLTRYRGYTLTRSTVTRYLGYTLTRSNVTRYMFIL